MERSHRRYIAWWAAIGALLSAGFLAACSSPARRADALARGWHIQREIEVGNGFRHIVYRNNAPVRGGALHVYIEGDGTPYWQRDLSATDPTPRDPLMLRLMALDSAPSVYLGRPCYFGLYRDAACHPAFWTVRRYGPEVLGSLETVLRAEATNAGASRVELFGHSGGGTLAVLLAQRVGSVTRVVTLGANLDLAAWCKLHDFSPLIGSLNPVDQPAMRDGVAVLHLVGDRDTNTPPSLVASAALARGGEPVRVIADFDHTCCWASMWRSILGQAL
jgi:hypothetical protein